MTWKAFSTLSRGRENIAWTQGAYLRSIGAFFESVCESLEISANSAQCNSYALFLFILTGPLCFAARTDNSSFSQYLGSRGSLAEYDTLSICRQLLTVIPRSSLAHLLAASERLSAFEDSYFLGWVSPERLQTLSNILCLLC